MTNKFFDAEGSTPLDPDDLKGLLPKHVTTQNLLNFLMAMGDMLVSWLICWLFKWAGLALVGA